MKTICLCMIMKNEASIITKCLESVANYISYWVINDNGSTDNTVEIVTNFFKKKNIPGKLLTDSWVGFAHNRSFVFKEAERSSNCDWMYVIDADDHLATPLYIPDEPKDADSFIINIQEGPNVMQTRQQLFRIGLDWVYAAIVHEYPASKKFKAEKVKVCKTDKIRVIASRGGDRSKDPLKYWKDAILMEKDLVRVKAQKNNLPHWEKGLEERYLYYICQSWHDFGKYDDCIKWAEQRVKVNGFKEEIYRAYLLKGRCLKYLHKDPNEITKALNECIKYDPYRAEGYFDLVDFYVNNEQWKEADELIKKVVKMKRPGDKLFIVEDYTYKFGAKKEAAWISYKLGRYEESYKTADLLTKDFTNQDEHRTWAYSIKYKNVEHLLPDRIKYNPTWKNIKNTTKTGFVVNFNVSDYSKAKKTISSWLNCCSDKYEVDQWFYQGQQSKELEDDFPFLQFKSCDPAGGRGLGDICVYIDDNWVFFHKELYVEELKNIKDAKIVYLNSRDNINNQPIFPLVDKGKSKLVELKTVSKMPYVVYKQGEGIFSLERVSSVKQ